MGEWLARLGASWGAIAALAALLILAAAVVPQWVRRTQRRRVHRDELHVEEFREAVQGLLAELENAAADIESRVAAQLDRLCGAEQAIEEKLRRLALIDTATNAVSTQAHAHHPIAQTADAGNTTVPGLSIPASPPIRELHKHNESRSRRAGRFAKSMRTDHQSAQFEEIRRLAADGATPAAIAEQMRLPLGDVEVLLSLRELAR